MPAPAYVRSSIGNGIAPAMSRKSAKGPEADFGQRPATASDMSFLDSCTAADRPYSITSSASCCRGGPCQRNIESFDEFLNKRVAGKHDA